jgi:hypothetical protein
MATMRDLEIVEVSPRSADSLVRAIQYWQLGTRGQGCPRSCQLGFTGCEQVRNDKNFGH